MKIYLNFLWFFCDQRIGNRAYVFFTGFLEREIKKDAIPLLDTGENPDAPQPREMIDLEVHIYYDSL